MKARNLKIYGGVGVISLFSALTTLFFHNNDPIFTHVDYTKKSNTYVVIYHGHGDVHNGEYTTAGKQSPTWPDSLKIYEGYSCKILALDLSKKLSENHIDNIVINNYPSDMSLLHRVIEVNEIFKLDNRAFAIFLHHNAQPTTNADYTDFEGQKGFTSTHTGGATGIEMFTSPGYTESDNFTDNYLLPQLKGYLPGTCFRNSGKSKEANFYVLTRSLCPAVIVEWNFMTTWTDCKDIADPQQRDDYTSAICVAFKNYNDGKESK